MYKLSNSRHTKFLLIVVGVILFISLMLVLNNKRAFSHSLSEPIADVSESKQHPEHPLGTHVLFSTDIEAPIMVGSRTQIQVRLPAEIADGAVVVETENGLSNLAQFEVGTAVVPNSDGQGSDTSHVMSGMINSDTVWDEDVYINGDITVEAGVTLTIEPGVTVLFAPNTDITSGGFWEDKSEINVYGTLIADGTTVAPIYFASVAATPLPEQWGGIVLRLNSTSSSLSHCMIRHAVDGIRLRDVKQGAGHISGSVSNCTISENGTGIHMFSKSGFVNPGIFNVDPTIKNNLILNNENFGIEVVTSEGFGLARNEAVIQNNVITNNPIGINILSNSWWEGRAETLTVIQNNTIQYSDSDGIYIQAAGSSDNSGSDTIVRPVIENNLLQNNQNSNMYLFLYPRGADGTQNLEPIIQYNTFKQYHSGIVISETASINTLAPIIINNLFFGGDSSGYSIDNQTARIISAQSNYWGKNEVEWDAGPNGDDMSGQVDVSHYLDSTALPLLTRIEPAIGDEGNFIILHGANFGLSQTWLPIVMK